MNVEIMDVPPRGERHAAKPFLGIDGEGFNDTDTRTGTIGKRIVTYSHQRYVVMTAASDDGYESVLSEWAGEIGTKDALKWILSLPDRYLIVGYSLGYDYTKLLKDVPRDLLRRLFHPEWPDTQRQPPMLYWQGFGLRWLNGKLEIKRGPKRRIVWDVFRFFQMKFVDALAQWLPEEKDALAFIAEMKGERQNLADLPAEQVERYGLDECRYLARMMDRVRQACKDADIPLGSYYGAGSIASGLIKRHGTKAYQPQDELSAELSEAIAAAFYGGRFESAVHGPVRRPIYETDVSSAYPSSYLTLPCLACGYWVRKPNDTRATLAYCKWNVPPGRWGPFPMRCPDLRYPLAGEGWLWRSEIDAAERIWPGSVEQTDGWCYYTACDHDPHGWVHERFAQRLAWSKEQRGIVLKLGLNAIYGKYAQRVGDRNGAYTCLAWAGMITAYTRSRLLDALGNAPKDSIIAFATDGILSLVDLGIGTPDKRLGGWESKEGMPAGAFFVANGLVIPYDGTKAKTRGYNAASITAALPDIERAWADSGIQARVGIPSRQFVNVKLALQCEDESLYGEWIDELVDQGFDPSPGRSGFYVGDDGVTYSLPGADLDTSAHCAERCNVLKPLGENARDRRLVRRALDSDVAFTLTLGVR